MSISLIEEKKKSKFISLELFPTPINSLGTFIVISMLTEQNKFSLNVSTVSLRGRCVGEVFISFSFLVQPDALHRDGERTN